MSSVRRAAALTVFWEALRGHRQPGAPGVGARLAAVPRMVSAGLSGRYPLLQKSRLATAVLGSLYVLSPIDFVPELFLAVLGLGDDALVAAFVVGSLLSEVDAFLEWEEREKRTVSGEVVS